MKPPALEPYGGSLRLEPGLLEVLESLMGDGWGEAEVFYKKGRSRHHLLELEHSVTSLRQEEGWAARAGDGRRSFFYAASGTPRPPELWPEADGQGLRLPTVGPVPSWAPPSDLDAPLLGENEAQSLFEGLASALSRELPGARLVRGSLEDGSSESQLASNRGMATSWRQRLAMLYLEAMGPRGSRAVATLQASAREARQLSLNALARRLADRLTVADKGQVPELDRAEMVLAPGVMAALLAALRSAWLGPGASEQISRWAGSEPRIASPGFTLVDDGRLPGGLLAAPVDGEGLATRAVTIVEEGRFRQPLLPWWQAQPRPGKDGGRPVGCVRRAGWRDLPALGPSHLYLQPDLETSPANLLAAVTRGYYVLDLEGPPRVDEASGRFLAPVCGFRLRDGAGAGAFRGGWLSGTVASLLRGLEARARDLAFTPLVGGLVGAPTVRIRGLEIRPSP